VPTAGFLVPAVQTATVPVERWLSLQADLLRDAVISGEPAAIEVLRFAGMPTTPVSVTLDIDAAHLAVAKDHWYADWTDALAHGDDVVDARFEAAAEAIHAGHIGTLRRLVTALPDLVTMHSPFPHRQTLLHHVAANGIEVERQLQSPSNATDILRLLIDRGADPDALCDSYGGGNGATTLCLLVSSSVPATARTQVPLVEELCRARASVNGLDDDGVPLWTAISFGYTQAAEALARGGARVDNLCFAAALGDLESVRHYFDMNGELRADVPRLQRIGTKGSALDPDRIIEYALIWAAMHDRLPVVEFLLTKDPDLRTREPLFRANALGAARHFGHGAIVALLEPLTPSA
jgi:hypothetical protein